MFSRGEASRIRQEFWTAFGKYMRPVLSAEGLKINWINYHTKVKDVYFRMDAGPKHGFIGISIEHHDSGIRDLYFEQFLELKTLLHTTLGETWTWKQNRMFEGRAVHQIYIELSDKSIFKKEDWPALISFFKPRIIALDTFWENARYSFDALR